jgi:CHAT domain-containing protein
MKEHSKARINERRKGPFTVEANGTVIVLDMQSTNDETVNILGQIAAHREYCLDQPDLSYLQLADGQLYADDMLQQDLSYELVALSACETGRANVAASDELIGLGRGFLYAGAGALLVSLWNGVSKAAALHQAQRSILIENREFHPAHWGAFQLIGNAEPLSAPRERLDFERRRK